MGEFWIRTRFSVSAWLCLTVLGGAGAAWAQEARPTVSSACRTAMATHWQSVMDAYGKQNWDEALAASTEPKASCAEDPAIVGMIGALRAEVDLHKGAPATALAELKDAPVGPDHPFWTRRQALALAAGKAVGDATVFQAAAEALAAANERGLTGDETRGVRKVERIEGPTMTVDAFERTGAKMGKRYFLFVALPKGTELPSSFELNESGDDAFMMTLTGKRKASDPFLADLNTCGMHATLVYKPSEIKDYAAVRAKALDVLTSKTPEAAPVVSSTAGDVTLCDGVYAVFPGLPRVE